MRPRLPPCRPSLSPRAARTANPPRRALRQEQEPRRSGPSDCDGACSFPVSSFTRGREKQRQRWLLSRFMTKPRRARRWRACHSAASGPSARSSPGGSGCSKPSAPSHARRPPRCGDAVHARGSAGGFRERRRPCAGAYGAEGCCMPGTARSRRHWSAGGSGPVPRWESGGVSD